MPVSYVRSLGRRLRQASIWGDGAVAPEEFKYRNLKRIWLPMFDVLSILIGVLGIAYGSTVLNSLYDPMLVDIAAGSFVVASGVALAGVLFPALWLPEILGKIVMVTLLGAYSISVWVSFFHGEVQSGFVAAILMLPILLPLFRLQLLGEEIKQRRNDEA